MPTPASTARLWLYIDHQLKPVNVRLGITDGVYTEILGDDLQEGTPLVTGVTGLGSTRATAQAQGNGNPLLGNQGRVHVLMAAHSMQKLEKVYGSVFEGILGEKISTKPVEVVTPFPWVKKGTEKAGG